MYLATLGGKTLARRLFDIGAVKFAKEGEPGWRLKLHETNPDAPLSPLYFNLRTPDNPKPGPLDWQTLGMIAAGFEDVVDQERIHYSAVCGIPNAGEPIAATFLRNRPTRSLELMKSGDDASGRRISGVKKWTQVQLGDAVLLIDDVITGADTKVEAIEAICAVALTVHDLLVVVDREQGGVAELKRRYHVGVRSLFRIRSLLIFYLAEGLIQQATYNRAIAYLAHEDATRDPVAHV